MSDEEPPLVRRFRAARDGDPPSVLRAVSIGSVFEDLGDDWEELDADQQRRTGHWMKIGALGLVAGAIAVAVLTALDLNATNVVHVFARTEHVRYTPLKNDPPQWLLEGVTIHPTELDVDQLFGDPDMPSGDAVPDTDTANLLASFDGYFQPRCGDSIVLNKVGTGALEVSVRSSHRASFTDRHDRPVLDGGAIGKAFTFVVPAPARGDDAAPVPARSTVWPLEGRIDPGRAVGPQTSSVNGLLLEGRVEVIAGRVMDLNYAADRHELELGDQVLLPTARRLDGLIDEIAEETRKTRSETPDAAGTTSTLCRKFDDSGGAGSTDKGFVHLDDGKGMNISFSSNSRYAEIVRYRTAPIRVENNWLKRLVNDPLPTVGWTALGVSFFLYRRAVRWRVTSFARAQRNAENP